MKTKLLQVIGIVVAFFIFLAVVIGFSTSNSEISLREKIEAQKQSCEAYYDKVWKVIAQKTQVAEQYKDAFKQIYPELISGRYGDEKGGTLMKWITESNPTFDISLYKDVSSAIEGQREGFFMEQRKLIDLDREHKVLRKSFPYSIFVGSRPDVEYTIITSDKTQEVYKTGRENEIDLFKK